MKSAEKIPQHQLRAYLVKGSSVIALGLFFSVAILSILGLPQIAISLLANSFPWLYRGILLVGFALSFSALKEAM
jgi:hypothetical protein